MAQYKKLVIGIDQSYTRTGISIAGDGKLLKVSHISFEPSECHSEKRYKVTNILTHAIKSNQHKATRLIVIVERIRQFSGGHLSMGYIKSTGALIGAIVDCCRPLGISVYSVDTRVWKAAVVGTCKPKENKYHVDPKKWPTIEYMLKRNDVSEADLLVPVSNRCKNYAKVIEGVKYCYNDDASDGAGIALYGFVQKRQLQKED